MLTRLLQAAAITCAIYLIMICSQLPSQQPAQQPVSLITFQRPALDRLGHLLVEVIDLFRTRPSRGA